MTTEEYLKKIIDLLEKENNKLKNQNEFLMKKDNVLQNIKQWLKDNIEQVELNDWSEDYLTSLSEVLSKIEELESEK